MEDQAENDDQHGNDGKKFQMGQTAAGEAVPEKKCNSKLIHGMMKNANVYPKEGWETGKMYIECIEMYRNVSDKKMELYMYNSKKNGVIHV